MRTQKHLLLGFIFIFLACDPLGNTDIKDENENVKVDTSVDLSIDGTANCYIINQAGEYKFKAIIGNSNQVIDEIHSTSVLWESFGTLQNPQKGSLVKAVQYSDGYVRVKTNDTYRKGNAVIAVKDKNDKILWSWHLWFTEMPAEHEYNNNAGVLMDRNLGAMSANCEDGYLTHGLLYQWGRKDPFLGTSSIERGEHQIKVASTIVWPDDVNSDSNTGTIEYSISHPTTYIANSQNNYCAFDWLYEKNDNLWRSNKTIYDPCPVGWRVPDGGYYGTWAIAMGSPNKIKGYKYDKENAGINAAYLFAILPTNVWYPATATLSYLNGDIDSYDISSGFYWTTSTEDSDANLLHFNSAGSVSPNAKTMRAYGASVRCLKIK